MGVLLELGVTDWSSLEPVMGPGALMAWPQERGYHSVRACCMPSTALAWGVWW